MSKLKTVLVGVGLGVSAMAIAQAAEPVLHLKPGLWQSTTQVNVSGQAAMPAMPSMPESELAKLPPAQRARIEQMLKNMPGTAGKPIVTKSCITEKDLEDARNFAPERPDCKQTILKQTATDIQMKYECTGENPTSMTGEFKTSSPLAYSGEMHGTATVNGHTMTIANTMQGKWLGSDCGDVKPMSHEPPKTEAEPN